MTQSSPFACRGQDTVSRPATAARSRLRGGAERRWTRPLAAPLLMLAGLMLAGLAAGPLYGDELRIAEQSWRLGDYVAHANAVRTDFLTPEIADKFEIERSNEQALITVSVQQASGSAPADPVAAEVRVTATRTEEAAEAVAMRTHRADDDIYHLGVLPIHDGERIHFEFAITPAPDADTYRFGFARDFFTD